MSSSVTCWVSVHDISDRTGDSTAVVICWHRTVAGGGGGVQTIPEHDTIGFGHHGVEVIRDRMSVVACLWRPITGHTYAHDGTSVRWEVMRWWRWRRGVNRAGAGHGHHRVDGVGAGGACNV